MTNTSIFAQLLAEEAAKKATQMAASAKAAAGIPAGASVQTQQRGLTAAAAGAARASQAAKNTAQKAAKSAAQTASAATAAAGTTRTAYYSPAQFGADLGARESAVAKSRLQMDLAVPKLTIRQKTLENAYAEANQKRERYYKLRGQFRGENAAQWEQKALDEWTAATEAYRQEAAAYEQAYGAYKPHEDAYRASVDDYNNYLKSEQDAYEAWRGTIRSADEIKADQTSYRNAQKELEALMKVNNEWARLPKTADTDALIAQNQQRINELQAYLGSDGEKARLLQEELEWSQYYEYDKLRQEDDFDTLSQYQTTANGGRTWVDADTGVVTGSQFNDPVYDYINRNSQAAVERSHNNRVNDLSYLESMTDYEISMYNYVYAKNGPEAAKEYLDTIRTSLTARQTGKLEGAVSDLANSGLLGATAASAISVGMSPIGGFRSMVGQTLSAVTGQELDPNAMYNRETNLKNAIRQTVSGKVEENFGPVGSFAYNTGMSILDMLADRYVGMGMTGGLGVLRGADGVETVVDLAKDARLIKTAVEGGAKLHAYASPAVMTIMGSRAFSEQVIDSKRRGLSDEQALTLGLTSALAELVTERIGLDELGKLPNEDAARSLLGRIWEGGTGEGLEEGMTNIINFAADQIVSGEQSEFWQNVKGFQEEGFNKQDAFKKAMGIAANSLVMDYFGGFVSGGVFGAADRSGSRAKQKTDLSPTNDSEAEMTEKLNAERLTLEQAKQTAIDRLNPIKTGVAHTVETKAKLERIEKADTVAEVTGVMLGVDEERIQSAMRLSGILGKDIRFYTADAKGGNIEYGEYLHSADQIAVNARSPQVIAVTIGHELTHSVENTASYERLRKLVTGQMTGAELDTRRQEIRALYSKAGVELSDEDLDREVVAKYVEQHLLTDEKSIRRLVQDDRNVAQRIFDWLDSLWAKLSKSEAAQEREFVRQAMGIYRTALDETASRKRAQGARDAAAQAYADGDEAAGDAAIDKLYDDDTPDLLAPLDDDGASYSFGGVNAKGADLTALEEAKRMTQADVAADAIFRKTGWYQGADGKWRFEIDDSKMRYDKSGNVRGAKNAAQVRETAAQAREALEAAADRVTMEKVRAYDAALITNNETRRKALYEELAAGEFGAEFRRYADAKEQLWRNRFAGGSVGDYIDHEALFAQYPELRDMPMRFEDLSGEDYGGFYSDGEIILDESLRDAPEELLIHEIQHAIQEAEGFAKGATAEYWEKVQEGGNAVTRSGAAVQRALDRAERVLKTVPKDVAAQFRRSIEMRETDFGGARDLAEKLVQSEHGEAFEEYCEAMILAEEKRNPFELYWNTAGEIEARDVARRQKLDAGTRKKRLPDTGDGNTVFVEKGNFFEMNADILNESDLEEELRTVMREAESFDGRYINMGKFSERFAELVAGQLELKDIPVVMNYRDAYLAMESKETGRYQGQGINYHNLGIRGMMEAIQGLNEPVAIMKSKKDGKIELALSGVDSKGNGLLAIVAVNTVKQNAGVFAEVHVVTSVYGRRNIDRYIEKAKAEGREIYNKKEELAQGITQVRYEGDFNASSPMNRISDFDRNVKRYSIGEVDGEGREYTMQDIGTLQQERYQLKAQRDRLLIANPNYARAVEERRYANTFKERIAASKALRAAESEVDTAQIDRQMAEIDELITSIRETERLRHQQEREKYSGTKTRGYAQLPDTRIRELDEEYMNAVRLGDRQRMERLVRQAAEAAMPKSTVRGSDGKLLKVYHYTNGEFTVFDRGMARTGNEMDGFFFAPDPDSTKEYGSNVITAYLNITNPAKDPVLDRLHDDSGTLLREKLAYEGYDGVVRTEADGSIYEYMAFDPEQIKSAEPVVYDESGNVIPLSERFDFGKQDIRYSIGAVAENADDGDTKSETPEGGVDPEELTGKPRQHYDGARKKMATAVAKALDVPRQAKREFLEPIVEKMAGEYLRTGAISRETRDELFETAWEQGRVVDTEFYDTYKDVKAFLHDTAVTISESDRWPGFAEFRQDAFGTLRIKSEGGTPVDILWEELREMAPALFPENILNPEDQLRRMLEVGRSIRKSERNLDTYYGEDAAEMKDYSRMDFESAIQDAVQDLWNVRRVAAEQKAETSAVMAPVGEDGESAHEMTVEEVVALYPKLKDARKAAEKAMARNLLSKGDKEKVQRLLRHDIQPEHLDPKTDNVAGIMAVYEAKKAYEEAAEPIRRWNQQRKARNYAEAEELLAGAGEIWDKKAGWLYSREIMERNIRDIVKDPEAAERIIKTYFTPVHDAEAAATRMKNEYRDRIRALKLSRKVQKGNQVSESYAVQFYGEVSDILRMMEESKFKIRERDGKSYKQWQAELDALWQNNPKLDQEKVKAAAAEFGKIYEELFQKMNEARVANGYEPVNHRSGYFPHFQQEGRDGILAQFGKALGIDVETQPLPTTINGLTHTFKPGIRWFGNALERKGFQTAYDAVEGFDRYIEGVADVVHQTENIQRLRALANQLRYRTGDEGLREQIRKIQQRTDLNDEEKDAMIKAKWENGRYELSNFVVELDEYTNLLANKKSRADRNMEQALGRNAYNVVKAMESRVAANMVAINPGSWLTNFIPITQGWACLGTRDLIVGMGQTVMATRADDGIVDRSSFLTNRQGSERLVQTWDVKASSVLGKPMEWIDGFTSGSLVRARYQQNLRRGMSEMEAMAEADEWTAGVMADRSKGAMPTVFNRSNPFTKLFTQFQLEVNNQYSYLLKDIPRQKRDKYIKSLVWALMKFAIGAWLYNNTYEHFFGRRPALDPIDLLAGTAQDLMDEETTVYEDVAGLTGDVLEQTPFIGGLLGGGRVPISSALPDWENLGKAVFNDEWSAEKRFQTGVKELLKPAVYILPPFGGGQIKKIWEGLQMIRDGGSYTMDAEGNLQLQYPLYSTDDAIQKALEAGQAMIFGKTTIKSGREWVEGGFGSLSAEQTATYRALLEMDVSQKEAFELMTELRHAEKTDDESRSQRQRAILSLWGLDGEATAVVYYDVLATEKEQELMDELRLGGADMGEVALTIMDIKDADAMYSGAAVSNAKREAIMGSGLSDSQKESIYSRMISDGWNDEIQAFADVDLSMDEFLAAQSAHASIKEQYEDEGDMAVAFSRWINGQDYTAAQEAVIRQSLKYWQMMPAEAGGYDRAISEGLNDAQAYRMSEELKALTPPEGKNQVQDYQKWRVAVDQAPELEDQLQWLRAAGLSGTSYEKVETGWEMGLPPAAWARAKEVTSQYDTNANGSLNQAEIKALIDGITTLSVVPEEGKYHLTQQQKAVLWQMLVGKNTKATNNPYSPSAGKAWREAMGYE